ncbi:Rne/Rng family ribonuclease [Trueperella sp. LYQ141]|uniref:Rne/Rng family ribonuclease n=1 Tax=Trueperella sp. LYQ141 TaxID=3391058 RepID=UPI003982E1C7
MADYAENTAEKAAMRSAPVTALLFQEPDMTRAIRSRRKHRDEESADSAHPLSAQTPLTAKAVKDVEEDGGPRRRSRRSRSEGSGEVQPITASSADESTERRSKRVTAKKKSADNEEAGAELSTSVTSGVRKRSRTARASRVADTEAMESAERSAVDSDENTERSTSEESTESGLATATIRRRRRRRSAEESEDDGVAAPKGSTRLEAKKRRRKEGRKAGRRRQTISESEYLARREAVDRTMLVREQNGLNQIAVLEDGVLVEHYVARHTQTSMVGNVYLGRVQNVLPSMEAAFVDIGKGRNAVLYSGEVDWDAVGMANKARKIEDALKSGDTVLVQVTKDPIGHKGARLTGQVTLPGRHLVLVPGGSMTGISRKLPEKERARLKTILKKIVPSEHGVIVRTAAEGATEEQLQGDVDRLMKAWADIQAKSKSSKNAPSLLKGEPELAVRVVRDIFNEDFTSLVISGDEAWETISEYVRELSPELSERLTQWQGNEDIFARHRVDEQLAKAFDRKVFLPSGGSLIIERTEAMTVIDVNTGKFTGSGGTLEETVTRNNLEAAEEIVRQLRLRDIGGIIVIDFIDMVLEQNRDLVLRRLIECLGRDRTRHQVAEVTSLGLVQMTRKRVGQGLVEAFSTTCEACDGRGYITHENPVERAETEGHSPRVTSRRKNTPVVEEKPDPKHDEVRAALANIAAAASQKHEQTSDNGAAHAAETAGEANDGAQVTEHSAASQAEEKPRRGRRSANTTAKTGRKKESTAAGAGKKKAAASRSANGDGDSGSASDAEHGAQRELAEKAAAPTVNQGKYAQPVVGSSEGTAENTSRSRRSRSGADREKSAGRSGEKKRTRTRRVSTDTQAGESTQETVRATGIQDNDDDTSRGNEPSGIAVEPSDKPATASRTTRSSRRRVTSSGTITPASSGSSAIMSFPVTQ